MSLLKHFCNAVFRKRKKDYIPVYLKRFEAVDKLLEEGLMAVNLEQNFVAVDASVHMMYMNSQSKYNAFFDTVRAFINFKRGCLGMEMVKYNDRIDFAVMIRHTSYIDENTGELYDVPKENIHPVAVGFYMAGDTVYAPYKQNAEGEEEEEGLDEQTDS